MHETRHKTFKNTLALASAVVLGVCLCGSSVAAVPGVKENKITFGAILSLTGVFASGAKAQLAGARLYWSKINDNDGVCDGRTVDIIPRDHGYNPQKAVTAYSGLRNRILGIQLLTGTPMTEAVAPQMARDSVVAIPMSWSPELLGHRSILIEGTTYDVDMINAVDYLLKKGVLKEGDSIGYVYFQGDFGGAGLKGAQYAAEQHDITVEPFQVNPSVRDLSSQIRKMTDTGVKAIFMSVSPPLLANAAALSHTNGLGVPIIVPTPTYVPELLGTSAAGQINDRVMVVSPYNAWSADSPGVKSLRAEYKKAGDKSQPQQFFIAGYAAAQVMHDALEEACAEGDLSRDSLKKAFASVNSFDLNGLAVNVSYQDRSVPPSLSDYILEADKDAAGGLSPIMDQAFEGDDAQSYVEDKLGDAGS